MATPLPTRSNENFSVFKTEVEGKKVTTKRSAKVHAVKLATCTRCGAEKDQNEIGETGMCVACEEETLEERTHEAYTQAYGEPRGTDAQQGDPNDARAEDEHVAALQEHMAEDAGEEQPPVEVKAPKALGIVAQRAALRAAGLRVCNRHVKYLDRLPDAAKVAVEDHPVEVRPLSEFARGANWEAPCCKPCYQIYDGEWREAHRTPGAPTSKARSEAILARKITQRNQLNAEIEALQASLATQ
jgi:hypothetical protein